MAVIKNFNDEDQNQQGQQGSNQSAYIGGSQAGASPFSNQKSGSQNFQNLQKFMQANKNIDMQSGIVKNIGERSKMLGKSLGESQQKFLESTNPEKQRLEQAQQTTAGALANYQNIGAGPISDGTSGLSGEYKKQVEDVQKLRRGDFKSNFDIADLPKQQIATDKFNTLTSGAMSEKGRFDILNKAFGGLPGYSSNLARVDQLLLQGAGSDRVKKLNQDLSAFGKENLGQLGNLKQSREDRNALLRQLGGQAQEQVTGMLSSDRAALEESLVQKANQYKQDITNRQNAIKEKVASGQALNTEDANVLKMSPDEEFTKFYNANRLQTVSGDKREILARQGQGTEADISKYLNLGGTEDITKMSVADQQALLKSVALSRLAENQSLLDNTGKYGEGYNIQDFINMDKEKSLADIEKAFELKGTDYGDFTSAAALQALNSGDYNKDRNVAATQQYASGLDPNLRISSQGRTEQQALASVTNELNTLRQQLRNTPDWKPNYKELNDKVNQLQSQYDLLNAGVRGANIREVIDTTRSDALRKMIESGQLKDIGQIND